MERVEYCIIVSLLIRCGLCRYISLSLKSTSHNHSNKKKSCRESEKAMKSYRLKKEKRNVPTGSFYTMVRKGKSREKGEEGEGLSILFPVIQNDHGVRLKQLRKRERTESDFRFSINFISFSVSIKFYSFFSL